MVLSRKYHELHKRACVCNLNTDKEAILPAKEGRTNLPFALAHQERLLQQRMPNAHIYRRLQGQTEQQEPYQRLTRKAQNQHFSEHIGESKILKPLRKAMPRRISQPIADESNRNEKGSKEQPASEGTVWDKSGY